MLLRKCPPMTNNVADESLENFLSAVIKGEGNSEVLSEANRFDLNASGSLDVLAPKYKTIYLSIYLF